MRLCREAWGVDVDKSAQGNYRARISYGGRTYLIARFSDLESAKRAYDQAALALHGEHCTRLNYQDSAQHPIEDPKIAKRIKTIQAQAWEREQQPDDEAATAASTRATAACSKKRQRVSICGNASSTHKLMRSGSRQLAVDVPYAAAAAVAEAQAQAAAAWQTQYQQQQQQQEQQQQNLLLELRSLSGHAVEALDSWVIKDLPFLDEFLQDCQLPQQQRQQALPEQQAAAAAATNYCRWLQAGTEATAAAATVHRADMWLGAEGPDGQSSPVAAGAMPAPTGLKPLDHQASSSTAAMSSALQAAGLPPRSSVLPAAHAIEGDDGSAAAEAAVPAPSAAWNKDNQQLLPLLLPLQAASQMDAAPAPVGLSAKQCDGATAAPPASDFGPSVSHNSQSSSGTASPVVMQQLVPAQPAAITPQAAAAAGAALLAAGLPAAAGAGAADGLLDLAQSMQTLEVLISQSTALYRQLHELTAGPSASVGETCDGVHSRLAASTAFAKWWLATQKTATSSQQQQCLQLISCLIHG